MRERISLALTTDHAKNFKNKIIRQKMNCYHYVLKFLKQFSPLIFFHLFLL